MMQRKDNTVRGIRVLGAAGTGSLGSRVHGSRVRDPRQHWLYLRARRTDAELEVLLAEALEDVRRRCPWLSAA
jgi:hypothetical protein